jgi:plasmid stabilization system protein ParE
VPAYKVSQVAFDDLVNIGRYTENEWGTSQRNTYFDDLERQFEMLAGDRDYPAIKERSELRKGCFFFSINEYIIIFRKTNYGIRIVRVVY